MMSMSYPRSSAWTASVVAVVGLFGAADLAFADPANRAPAEAQSTAATTRSSAAQSAVARPDANSAATPTTAMASSSPLKVICLQNTRCFSVKPVASTAANRPAMDLRAPALTRVFTQAQLSEKLEEPEEEYDATETVQVEGAREMTPVSVGLMAIPWAIIHPTQAWRILMPVPDAK